MRIEEKTKIKTIKMWFGRRDWITNHLGTKPRSGGRPAWDKRIRTVGILRGWLDDTRAVRSAGDWSFIALMQRIRAAEEIK